MARSCSAVPSPSPPRAASPFWSGAVLKRRLSSLVGLGRAAPVSLQYGLSSGGCVSAALPPRAPLSSPLPAPRPLICALALFGGGAGLQLRPRSPFRVSIDLSPGGFLSAPSPASASALFGVARCFSGAPPLPSSGAPPSPPWPSAASPPSPSTPAGVGFWWCVLACAASAPPSPSLAALGRP